MGDRTEKLLVIGGSVRAAAQSAVRSGWRVCAADYFADADLIAICPTTRVRRYPAGFRQVVADSSCDGWMYTGGLENYPRTVRRLAGRRRLFGNDAPVLRRVRDPEAFAAALERHGLDFPEIRRDPRSLTTDGRWIVKGERSSGGAQIRELVAGDVPAADRRTYYQRRVEGRSAAAIYVAAAGRSVFVGVSRQLVGVEWTRAQRFHYSGSIGPLELEAETTRTLARLGDALAAEFQLQGLFGVDFVLAEGRVWTIEVNPRYSASIEVLERQGGLSAVELHVRACRDGELPAVATPATSRPRGFSGKAILFARRDLHITSAVTARLMAANVDPLRPSVADIPNPGAAIVPGAPVATVVIDGANAAEVESLLRERVAWLESLVEAE